MSRQENSLRHFLSDNRRFAELINRGIFGHEVLHADRLRELDSVFTDRFGRKLQRDIIKEYQDGHHSLILALELQSVLCFYMPFRTLQYDYTQYDQQVEEIQRKNRENNLLRNGERMYWFSESDRLIPIITVMFYYGDSEWTGPAHLQDLYAWGASTQIFSDLALDYHLPIIDARHIPDVHLYTPDMAALFYALQFKNSKRKLLHFLQTTDTLRIPETVYHEIGQIIDDSEMAAQDLKQLAKGGYVCMCKALDELRIEWKEQGKAAGIEEGKAAGIEEGKAAGEALLAKLILQLSQTNNLSEIVRVSQDVQHRQELYEKYHIL